MQEAMQKAVAEGEVRLFGRPLLRCGGPAGGGGV